jgi:hypothetical protein
MLRVIAVCLSLLVAACVAPPRPTLSVAEIQQYRLVDVRVEGAGVIRSWPAMETAYLRTANTDPDLQAKLQTEPASSFPQLTAFFERTLAAQARAGLDAQIGPVLTGARPVRAVVRLKTFDIPSGARRVLIDSTARISADIDLVDARTGATLVRYEGPLRARQMIGGLATAIAVQVETDPGTDMLATYLADYRAWLFQN